MLAVREFAGRSHNAAAPAVVRTRRAEKRQSGPSSARPSKPRSTAAQSHGPSHNLPSRTAAATPRRLRRWRVWTAPLTSANHCNATKQRCLDRLCLDPPCAWSVGEAWGGEASADRKQWRSVATAAA